MRNMKGIIFLVFVFFVPFAVIHITGDAVLATIATVFLIVLYGVSAHVEKLRKTDTAQQTQIDDLKRELEEVKGKMKE